MSRFKDITGQTFGRLTAIQLDDLRPKKGNSYWVCKCICGKEKSIRGSHLTGKKIQSCGCFYFEVFSNILKGGRETLYEKIKNRKIEKKNCLICKIVFEKPLKYSLKQWAEKKCCFNKKCLKEYFNLRANKKNRRSKICLNCKKIYFQTKPYGLKVWNKRKMCSMTCSGIYHSATFSPSEEQKRKHSIYMTGRPSPLKGKKRPKLSGENNSNWKGGITPIDKKLRNSMEYILWRTAVYVRDDYTCQICNIRGKKLNADHIKPWSLYPELRFAIDNGRTLCVDCHRQTDTYGARASKLSIGGD